MNGLEILRAVGALAGVLGLIFLGAWAMRRMRLGGVDAPLRGRPLKVVASVVIDPRRRASVLRWRGTDYLVAFGAEGVAVLDSKPADEAAAETPSEDNEATDRT